MDDLVKRLRQSWDTRTSVLSQTGHWMAERNEAADRIEALTADLAAARVELASGSFYKEADIDKMMARAEAAEAKLAQAVVVLERIACASEDDADLGEWGSMEVARAFLATLQPEGGTDD